MPHFFSWVLVLILVANKVAHRFGEQGIYKRS